MKYFALFLISFSIHASEMRITNNPINIIERVNLSIPAKEVNKAISEQAIEVFENNQTPSVQFIASKIYPEDKILLNRKEKICLSVNFINAKNKQEENDYIPFVGFRKHDDSKYYGLLPAKALKQLHVVKKTETKPEKILNHASNQNLTIVYALCPKNRKEVCEVTVKHQGDWVKNENGEMKRFKALAHSKREYSNSEHSQRLINNSDTPQGIYGLWASMYSDHLEFGHKPRIDIDLNALPINGYPFDIFGFTLSELLPPDSLEDYWVNELPLAYALGRNLFRIHGNPLEVEKSDYTTPNTQLKFAKSHGCLNFGEQIGEFYELMRTLGIFEHSYQYKDKDTRKTNIQWHPAKRDKFGKSFLIVKDV